MGPALATAIAEQIEALGSHIMLRVPERGLARITVGTPISVPQGQKIVVWGDQRVLCVLDPGAHRIDRATCSPPAEPGKHRGADDFSCFDGALLLLNERALEMRWGTRSPLVLHDEQHGSLCLRAHGTYAARITDATRFATAVHGLEGIHDPEMMEDFLRDIIVARLQLVASEAPPRAGELRSVATGLLQRARGRLEEDFARYGLELQDLVLETLILPDTAPVVVERHDGALIDPRSAAPAATGGPGATARRRRRAPRVQLAADAGVAPVLPRIVVQPLAASQPAAATTRARRCPDCAGTPPRGAHFCPWCGRTVVEER